MSISTSENEQEKADGRAFVFLKPLYYMFPIRTTTPIINSFGKTLAEVNIYMCVSLKNAMENSEDVEVEKNNEFDNLHSYVNQPIWWKLEFSIDSQVVSNTQSTIQYELFTQKNETSTMTKKYFKSDKEEKNTQELVVTTDLIAYFQNEVLILEFLYPLNTQELFTMSQMLESQPTKESTPAEKTNSDESLERLQYLEEEAKREVEKRKLIEDKLLAEEKKRIQEIEKLRAQLEAQDQVVETQKQQIQESNDKKIEKMTSEMEREQAEKVKLQNEMKDLEQKLQELQQQKSKACNIL